MAQIMNPEEILNLVQILQGRVSPPVVPGGDVGAPDAVEQFMSQYTQRGDPAAQGYDPNLVRNLTWKEPVVTGSPNQTVSVPSDKTTIPSVYDLNTGYIIGSPGDIEVRQGKRKPYTETPQQPGSPKQSPPTQPPTTQPPVSQPKQDGKLSGLEDYLQYFQKTLGDAPELDTKKRNQLAMVAAINALGQGLRQVVDYTGKVKHGAPINPQQDNLTGGLLSMYDKEMKEYEQRKDRYDLQKTNTMQDAFKYAYGDEKAREQYEKQLDLLGRQQGFAAEKAQQEAENRAALQKDKQGFDAAKLEYQRQADLDKLKTKYGYDVDLLNRRLSADAAKNAADVIEDQLKLAGDNIPVIDQKTGQSLVIPKELYWDVYQKIMNNPSAEMKKQMVQLMGADYQTSKQIVNGMIASEYRKYYEPQYDAAGQFQGWRMLDSNAPAPQKDYKTFWDFMPGSVPGAELPTWALPPQNIIQ